MGLGPARCVRYGIVDHTVYVAPCKRHLSVNVTGRFDGGAPFGTSGCVVVPCSVFLHRFVLPVYFGKLLCDAVKDLPYMKLR